MTVTSAVLSEGTRVLRPRAGVHSIRCHRRTIAVTAALVLVGVATGLAALVLGDYDIGLGDVVGALLGDRDGLADSIVVNWRLPRVLATLLFGAALGGSGALFQTVAANPLASPDVVGFDTGAATGALLVILVFRGDPGQLAAASLVGGVLTAVLVYVLAYRRGAHGFRLILVGISVSAMLAAVNEFLVTRAIRRGDLAVNQARSWLIGSLNGISWGGLAPAAAVLALLLPAAIALGRPLRWLELGDDTAKVLGVRLNPVRLGAVLAGVGMTATVTSAAGAISFVSLAAPQLAKRLARTPGLGVAPAMAMGAALLASSDLAALHALWMELPVGAVTVSLGGCYFVWLMWAERGRR